VVRHSMSVNFDQGSIPVDYDGSHEDLMPKLGAALDEAIRRGWIDEAEKKRHLQVIQDDHDRYLREGPSVHLDCAARLTVAGVLELQCQGFDVKYANVDGVQHRHEFHYADVESTSDDGHTGPTRITWARHS
jgi:hypothetical protein